MQRIRYLGLYQAILMNKFFLLLIIVFTSQIAFAQNSTVEVKIDTLNFGFEKVLEGKKLPDKWHIMSPNAKQYEVMIDNNMAHTGSSSIFISSVDTAFNPQFAGVGYSVPAKYAGKEITIKVWMKSEDMKGSLALMLAVYDADGNTLQFENLQNKKLKGTKDWKQYSVTLPLAAQAQLIHLGPILIGKGKLWADDVELFIDGAPIQKAGLKPDFNPNQPRSPRYGSIASAGSYIKLKDATLYYETYGSGEPLLLLHGNSQSIYAFTKQIPELSKRYKVIAVDTRSQGKSTDESAGPLTYDKFADDMKQLLDSLHISKTNILGWSDGGNTGLIMAIKYPSYVNKLAITGANLSPTTDAVDGKILNSIKQERDRTNDTDQQSIRKKRLMTMLLDEPHITVESLKLIKSPTLVMAGEKDMIKEKHTRTIANNITNSKLLIFKDATHYVPVEKIDEFNNAVIAFLSSK